MIKVPFFFQVYRSKISNKPVENMRRTGFLLYRSPSKTEKEKEHNFFVRRCETSTLAEGQARGHARENGQPAAGLYAVDKRGGRAGRSVQEEDAQWERNGFQGCL